ncbi:short-chain dehydrogenase [Kaistia sp. 32K]|uniref:SDR family oxidoreductase n=1 Tax=Kaistia sp. 32K TaxID=2795690 RepID=UPI001916AD32|nr:SDR family oxidoreductase [Kaistia sp. 32K]BCP51433.1 short-chain dehydrogenase [Kaistia sp. 32K]
MAGEFQGKRVLVTGASLGIGWATALRFREGGATVIGVSRRTIETSDDQLASISADLATLEGCASVADAVLSRLGGIDILVHALGGSSAPGGGFAALDESEWARELSLNLLSAVRLDRALLPSMLDRSSGVIVHVTSIQAQSPVFEATLGYAAAKAALANYSKGLSKEVSPKGVRVVRVSPGWTETEAAVALVERLADKAGTDYDTARADLMKAIGGIPIGRPNTPQDVAELIAFVASPRAATITGTELRIDGGSLPVV